MAPTLLAFRAMTALAMVSASVAPILIWLPVGVAVTKVKTVPPMVMVALFAGWALKTKLPVAATPTVVEKTVTVDRTAVAVKASLTKRAFGTSSPLDVTIRKAGTRATLGVGYVAGTKLTVFLPKGTALTGKYVLTRTSGAKKLPKSATVTIASTKSTKSAKR